MLGNCEKMVVIPTTTNNEWPQQITDQKISSLSMGSGGRTAAVAGTMEKPSGQDQQQSLKCPRCESTNTKFCYYNNYSLSQPRHFCKSCKRYWTRGGTLRNVPVGGGCRKNKRVRRQTPSSLSDHTPSNSSSSSPPNNNSNLPSHPHVSPLFYGLPGNNNSVNSDMNLVFPRFNSSSMSSYDHLGLGSFSSGYTSNDSLFSNYNSIFGNSMIFGGSSSSAISSLLNPSGSNTTTTFQGLLEPVEDHQVKVDEGRHNSNEIMEQHGSLLDYYSSTYYWNDQTNNNNVVGPSVTSMIE